MRHELSIAKRVLLSDGELNYPLVSAKGGGFRAQRLMAASPAVNGRIMIKVIESTECFF
jgi:hypothetical protein